MLGWGAISRELYRVQEMLRDNASMMGNFEETMNQLCNSTKKVSELAAKEAEAVESLKVGLTNMESDLTNKMQL
jgi:hypothetical protein